MADSYQHKRRDRDDESSKHNRRRPYPSNNSPRWPNRNQEDKDNQADDQIAPKHVSGSISHLQRWALATVNFPQHGHGKRENEIIERIHRRYANVSPGGYENPHAKNNEHVHDGHSTASQLSDPFRTAVKRRRSASPSGEDQSKKRRSKSPSRQNRPQRATAEDIEEDDDYAQSSEWSFPETEDERREDEDAGIESHEARRCKDDAGRCIGKIVREPSMHVPYGIFNHT